MVSGFQRIAPKLDGPWTDQLTKVFIDRMTCGSVFAVRARLFKLSNDNFTGIEIKIRPDEGNGPVRFIYIERDSTVSVPVQVELMFMDIECAPTWHWGAAYNMLVYYAEFANKRNLKVVKDSGADRYPVAVEPI